MGRDLRILSKHNLDFDNEDVLLKRLAHTHQANIVLAFYSYIDLSEDLALISVEGLDEDYTDYYELKRLVLDPSFPTIILDKEDYLYEWLFLKHGEAVGSLPSFIQHWTESPDKNLDIIQSFIADADSYQLYSEAWVYRIYKTHINYSNSYTLSRWWGFFDIVFLRRNAEEEHRDMLRAEIDRIKELSIKLGGNGAWYLDDQSSQLKGLGQGEEWDMDSWDEIEREIKLRSPEVNIIDLRKCLNNDEYMNMRKGEIGDDIKRYSVFYDKF